MPTRRQEALAVLDADLPPETPKTELLQKAGYSKTSAYASAKKLLESSGVQRAKEALEVRRLDSAPRLRAISEKALQKLDQRLDDGASDQLVLGAVKVTYDARAAGVDDDAETLTPQDRLQARAMVLRYCRIAARVAVYRALRQVRSVDGV